MDRGAEGQTLRGADCERSIGSEGQRVEGQRSRETPRGNI